MDKMGVPQVTCFSSGCDTVLSCARPRAISYDNSSYRVVESVEYVAKRLVIL